MVNSGPASAGQAGVVQAPMSVAALVDRINALEARLAALDANSQSPSDSNPAPPLPPGFRRISSPFGNTGIPGMTGGPPLPSKAIKPFRPESDVRQVVQRRRANADAMYRTGPPEPAADSRASQAPPKTKYPEIHKTMEMLSPTESFVSSLRGL